MSGGRKKDCNSHRILRVKFIAAVPALNIHDESRKTLALLQVGMCL